MLCAGVESCATCSSNCRGAACRVLCRFPARRCLPVLDHAGWIRPPTYFHQVRIPCSSFFSSDLFGPVLLAGCLLSGGTVDALSNRQPLRRCTAGGLCLAPPTFFHLGSSLDSFGGPNGIFPLRLSSALLSLCFLASVRCSSSLPCTLPVACWCVRN